MTDLAETIAKWRGRLERTKIMRATAYEIETDDLTRLLDAAERALALDSVGFAPSTPGVERARNAALEEAAQIAENACLVPPDGGSPTDAEREMCEEAARLIRKRKGAA